MKIAARWFACFAVILSIGCAGSSSTSTAPAPTPSNEPSSQDSTATASADEPPPKRTEHHRAVDASPGVKPTTPSGPARKPAVTERAELSDQQRQRFAALAVDLAGEDLAARDRASAELEAMGDDAVEPMVILLSDDQAEVRRGAAFFLIDRFNPANDRMVQTFADALSDSDRQVRHMALSVVKRFPREAQLRVIPQLTAMLTDGDVTPTNRAAIARLLGSLEAEAVDAIAALIESAEHDPDVAVRMASLFALSKVAAPKQAVAVFQKALTSDDDIAVRRLATARLERLGEAAAIAADDLAAGLESDDEELRLKSAEALIAIGPASVKPAAAKLRSMNAEARKLAVVVLTRLGAAAKPALPEIQRLARDPSEREDIRQLATFAVQVLERL